MFEKPLLLTTPPTPYDSKDVKEAQRILNGKNVFEENFKAGPVDGVMGQQTAGAIHRAKWLLGYPAKACNYAMGSELYDLLTGKTQLPKPHALLRKKREAALLTQNLVKTRAVDIAINKIGVTEHPPESNKTEFGEWYGYNGVYWCCIFTTYCLVKAGSKDFMRGSFSASVSAVVAEARVGHRHLSLTSDPQLGDLVDYNNGDHIEFFEKWIQKGRTFSAIGGNTSSSDGSYNNGGEVARNTRYVKGNFPVTHWVRVGA